MNLKDKVNNVTQKGNALELYLAEFETRLKYSDLHDVQITFNDQDLKRTGIYEDYDEVLIRVRDLLYDQVKQERRIVNKLIKEQQKRYESHLRRDLLKYLAVIFGIFYVIPYVLFSLLSWDASPENWFIPFKILGIITAIIGAIVLAAFIIEPPRDGM